jgi:hypothetical protein
VRVDLATLPEDVMKGIKRVLSNHPGEVAVSIELLRPAEFAALVRADDRLRVRLTGDLMTQLEALTGPGTIRLSRSA